MPVGNGNPAAKETSLKALPGGQVPWSAHPVPWVGSGSYTETYDTLSVQ